MHSFGVRSPWVVVWVKIVVILWICLALLAEQTMTEAKRNLPIPKLFDNRPSALAAKAF